MSDFSHSHNWSVFCVGGENVLTPVAAMLSEAWKWKPQSFAKMPPSPFKCVCAGRQQQSACKQTKNRSDVQKDGVTVTSSRLCKDTEDIPVNMTHANSRQRPASSFRLSSQNCILTLLYLYRCLHSPEVVTEDTKVKKHAGFLLSLFAYWVWPRLHTPEPNNYSL